MPLRRLFNTITLIKRENLMTIKSIDTTFKYPTPDLASMYASKIEIQNKIRSLSTIYLPVLAEELESFRQELNNTDKHLLDMLTIAPSFLEHDQVSELYNTVVTLESGTPSEQQKEAAASLYAEIQRLTNASLSSIKPQSAVLNNALHNLKAVTLTNNDFQIKELEKDIAAQTPRQEQLVKAIEELESDELGLNEAIKIIEAKDVFGILKDLLLTAESLAGANLTNPKIELIKAALSITAKVLDKVSEAMKYSHLIEARKSVQMRLDTRRQDLATTNNTIKDYVQRKEQLIEVQSIVTPREAYEREAGTIAESVNKFLEIIGAVPTNDRAATIQTFVVHAALLRKHLETLRAQWRT